MANVTYTLAQFMAREATASVSGVDTVTVSVANATELNTLTQYLASGNQVMIGFGLNITLANEGVSVTLKIDEQTNQPVIDDNGLPVFVTVGSDGKPTGTVYTGSTTTALATAFTAFAQYVDPSIPELASVVNYLSYVTQYIPSIQQTIAQIMNDAQPIVDDMGNYVLDEDGNMTFSNATLNSIAGLQEAVYQIFSAINGISGTLTSKVSMEDYYRLLNDAVYEANEDGSPVYDEDGHPILISAATPNSLAGIMALVNQLTVDYQAMDTQISESVAELRQDVIDNMNSVYQLIGAPSQPAVEAQGTEGEDSYVPAKEAVPATGVYVQVEQLIHQATLPIYSQIVNIGNAIAENGVAISSIINDGGVDGEGNLIPVTTNSIAGLKGALAALSTVVSDNDSAQTQALADAEAALDEAIQTVATNLTAAVAELEGADAAIISDEQGTFGEEGYVAPTTNSIAGLKAALAALTTVVDAKDADIMRIIGAAAKPAVEAVMEGDTVVTPAVEAVPATGLYATIDNAIAAAVESLSERMDGIDDDVETNSEAITDIQSDLDALTALVGEAASGSGETAVAASGIFAALASLQEQINQLSAGSQGQELGDVVVDINRGDKLPVVGANDTLTSLTIKGFDDYTGTVTTFLNLSDIPSSTTINFIGRSDDEIVQITASSTSTDNQEVTFNGGAGNDFFVVVGARNGQDMGVKSYASALDLDGDAGTSDTLVVVGEIDLSQSQITGFENLSLKANSPSNVTLTAAQLAGFDAVTGTTDTETLANSTVINLVSGSETTEVDLSKVTFTDVASINVGENAKVKFGFDQMGLLGTVAETAMVNVSLTNITLTKDTDVSNYSLGADTISVTSLAGYQLTIAASQAANTTVTDTAGTLLVTKLEATPAVDLSGFNASNYTLNAAVNAASDVTLTANLSTIDNLAVTGTETVTIDSTASLGTSTNISVAEASTLSLSAADASATVIGDITGTGKVTVTGLENTLSADLTSIASSLTTAAELDSSGTGVTLAANLSTLDNLNVSGSGLVTVSGATLGTDSLTINLADTSALSIAASEATALKAINGVTPTAVDVTPAVVANNVTIPGMAATTDLSTVGLEAELNVMAEIDTATVTSFTGNLTGADTLAVLGAGMLTIGEAADLAAAAITVDTSATLAIMLDDFNGRTITGAGTVSLTGDVTAKAVDITAIDVTNLTVGMNVGTNGSLTLTAKQANGSAIDSVEGNFGTVIVTKLEETLAANLSLIVAGQNLTAEVNTLENETVTLGTANLSTVDTLAIKGTGTANVNAATLNATGKITVADTVTLSIDAAKVADVATIEGTGFVTVTGLATSDTVDLDTIATELTVTAEVTTISSGVSLSGNYSTVDTLAVSGNNAVTIHADATLGTATDITVASASTLSISATDADATMLGTIEGAGITSVTGLAANADVDLSDVQTTTVNADLTMTADTQLSADLSTVDTLAVSGAFTATIAETATLATTTNITVAAGSTLSISATDADAAAIGEVTGEGNVTITNLEDALGATITDVNANGTVTAQLDSTEGTAQSPLVLTADLTDVDSLEIAGTGVVSLDSTAVLSPTASINLLGASQLYILAEDIGTRVIEGAGTVYVTGSAENLNLSSITANIDITGANLTGTVTYPDLANTQAITLTEGQATVATLADSTEKAGGLVTVVGLSSTTNLSGIDAGNSVTVMVNASIDATENENLGNADTFTVAANQTLTLTGAQVSVTDRTIDGAGSLTVTAVDANTSFAGVNVGGDLAVAIAAGTETVRNSVDLSKLSLTGVDAFAMGDYATLTLTAEQATGASITGSTSTAVVLNGSVETAYTEFDIAADVDATLAFTNTGVVNAASVFTGIDHLALAGDGNNGAAPETTMTAAQAEGKDFDGSTGGVIITDSTGNQEALVGTAFNDRFEMDISKGYDTIDLSAGGTDTIALDQSSTVKNGKTVNGFDAGVGGDVLDLSALELTSVAREAVTDPDTSEVIRAGEINPDADLTTASTASETFDQNQDLSGKVVILDNTVADSTSALQTAFSAYAKFSEEGKGVLNDGVDEGESKVFITDSAGESTNVFVWADTSDTDVGAVQALESTLAVDLVGVAVADITIDNVVVEVVGQPTGGDESAVV